MGDSKQSTTSSQTQSGTVGPYSAAVPQVNDILSSLNGINTAPTAAQTSAISQIQNNAQNTPNYANQATNLTNALVSGGPNYQPIVNSAYGQYQGAMNPFLTGSLDPMQTPGLSDALATIRNDVSNSVNGMFAGAGRDLSGANQQALARGIAQGEAPVIVGQYNQNVANRQNAANGLLSGAQSTANNLSNLQQTQFNNQLTGVTNGGNIVNTAANAGPTASLAASQLGYGLPIQNIAQLEALTLPIAGLGKTFSGTSNGQSETTNSPSLLSQIGAGVGIAGSLFSDPALKEDVREVGKLNDGQKIYSYQYKGDRTHTTHIGLMADEVQKKVPEAVGLLGGYRTVNYGIATKNARKK